MSKKIQLFKELCAAKYQKKLYMGKKVISYLLMIQKKKVFTILRSISKQSRSREIAIFVYFFRKLICFFIGFLSYLEYIQQKVYLRLFSRQHREQMSLTELQGLSRKTKYNKAMYLCFQKCQKRFKDSFRQLLDCDFCQNQLGFSQEIYQLKHFMGLDMIKMEKSTFLMEKS